MGGEAPEGVRTKRGPDCVSHRCRHRGGIDRALHERAAGREGGKGACGIDGNRCRDIRRAACRTQAEGDRKSTRLNSSHLVISYAVFCLKKKKTTIRQERN